MAKIVQILTPTTSIGYQLLALDSDGQLLIGTITTQRGGGPVVTWQIAVPQHK